MKIPPTKIADHASVRIALRHPFWMEPFYSMTIRETTPEDEAQGLKTLATDGRNLWICKEFWKGYSLDYQTSALVHELYHKILFHNSRRGSRDPYLWNVACDYVINAAMYKQGFKFPMPPAKGAWLYESKYDGWLAEAVYNDLVRECKEQGGSGHGSFEGQPGVPDLGGMQDLRDAPGTESPEAKDRYESEVRAMVDRAVTMAKAMGTLPVGMDAEMARAQKVAQEPWYNHLHRFMQSLSVSEYNWAKMNRRALLTHKVLAPAHYAESLGEVALFIDTSGSCYDSAQQCRFAEHLNAILAEAKPQRVHIFYFDTRVYPGEVVEAGEIDVDLKPRGGGGTSFRDLFTHLEEEGIEPAVAIVLTDLYGAFPDDGPQFPVIWACTEPDMEAPFGETIHINND